MPIYEYVCESCGHSLDVLQKLSEAPLKDCPGCQQPTLRKRMSASGFKLTGTGWYETDFKNKGTPPAAKSKDASAKPKTEPSA